MSKRPKSIKPRFNGFDLAQEALSLVFAVLAISLWFIYKPDLPDRVPVHYDAKGVPNGWGTPIELLILPMVSLGVYVLLTLLNLVPHMFNYPIKVTEYNAKAVYTNGTRMIRAIKTVLTVGFFFMLYTQLESIVDGSLNLSPYLVWGLLIAVSIVISRYLIALFKLSRYSKKPV